MAAVALALSCVGYALPKRLSTGEKDLQESAVLRLWHIDGFEGGKGSRASFLKRVATEYRKKRSGAFVLVSSYTKEGAKEAFSRGEYPDMLSFSVGTCPPIERCIPLSFFSFFGANYGGSQLALPWCKGGYALYAKVGCTSTPTAENTVVSVGGNNLPIVAACFEGLSGAKEQPSITAYTEFLAGKYDWLLGTQRDFHRFSSRGVETTMRALTAYSDLYQYIAVLNGERSAHCEEFLRLLFSDAWQDKLSSVGMASALKSVGALGGLESVRARFTLGAFTDTNLFAKICAAAREGNEEVLRKFLKSR